jgi:DNA repair protein RecN (Recombination protein N)
MLEEIRIQNFAIIDRLELSFDKGFNVITGETGAGKSIIIDAVELLIGGRADAGVVRSGADRAVIEGTFALDALTQARVQPILERENLLEGGDNAQFVTLSREVRANGRSSGRINGISVANDILREVGEELVDIHGQSSHMSLFKPRLHIDLLDKYADLLEVRAALASVVRGLDATRAEIRRLTEDKDALARRAERLRYAIEEISAANLTPGEDENLLAERNRLANSEQLATLANEAHALLSGDERDEMKPAVDLLMQVTAIMGKLARIDPSLQADYALAQELSDNAQELAITMSSYAEGIEYNPARLDDIEERIELIKSLKKRYNAASIEALNAYAAQASEELAGIENSDERLAQLRAQEEKTLRHIGELAERISGRREAAGRQLARRIVQELKDLRMERTQFEVQMQRAEDENGCYGKDGKRYAFDTTGVDRVEFMMSANPGEPLRPLAKVASGGEAARIMLALKRVLTQADHTPLLIFDEIDQGIGGRIGSIVGEKLWSLTNGHQVMCVTHLPQLASFSDRHYRVQKMQLSNRTSTVVTPLDEDSQKVEELAQMLGAFGSAGQESARELLAEARSRKQQLSASVTTNPAS